MGFFDLPAPLFTALDGLLGGLGSYPRLLVWAAFTGAISMFLYWLCSAQDKVGAAKERAIAARKAMAGYEGTEFDEMFPLAKESLAASLKHFALVLGPALLSSLPALAIIVWVSNQFGYILPEAGEQVSVYTVPETTLSGEALDGAEPGQVVYRSTWPQEGMQTVIATGDGQNLTSLPLAGPVPVVHKRVWWNSLIANPNGYLEDDQSIEAVYFDLESQQFLDVGPGWVRGWEFSYFVLLIVVSLIIKFAFRIH